MVKIAIPLTDRPYVTWKYTLDLFICLIRLNYFFSNDAFLDKEESCNKLVVLKYFCAWYI